MRTQAPQAWLASKVDFAACVEDHCRRRPLEQGLDQFNESIRRPPPFDHQVRSVCVDHDVRARIVANRRQLARGLAPVFGIHADRAQTVRINGLAPQDAAELEVDVTNRVLRVEVHQMRVIAPLVLRRLAIKTHPAPGQAERRHYCRVGRWARASDHARLDDDHGVTPVLGVFA